MVKRNSSNLMLSFFYFGVLLFVIGLFLSYPFSFDWNKVKAMLFSLSNVYWKVYIVSLILLLISFVVSKNKKAHPIIAENIGATGFFLFLSPLFFVNYGLPEDLGYGGIPLMIGLMVIVSSLSFMLSKMMLGLKS
jgi:peptidoglycan/LPS O-acetylase OafA/YrhL